MFSLKAIIFNLYSPYDKATDLNKDGNGKGSLERYNEALAQDLDTEIIAKIETFIDDTLKPQTVLEKFLSYLEGNIGGSVNIGEDIPLKRKTLEFITKIYQVRGTTRSYEILLKLLGFDTVIVTDDVIIESFDGVDTFDSSNKTFDSTCKGCSGYSIQLTGSISITGAVLRAISNIIRFCEPINADLSSIIYNGSPLPDIETLSIFVNSDGDLVYTLGEDGTIVITITNEGDLIIEGDTASHYSLNADGDFVYTP